MSTVHCLHIPSPITYYGRPNCIWGIWARKKYNSVIMGGVCFTISNGQQCNPVQWKRNRQQRKMFWGWRVCFGGRVGGQRGGRHILSLAAPTSTTTSTTRSTPSNRFFSPLHCCYFIIPLGLLSLLSFSSSSFAYHSVSRFEPLSGKLQKLAEIVCQAAPPFLAVLTGIGRRFAS